MMPTAKSALFLCLGGVAAWFCVAWLLEMRRRGSWSWPSAYMSLVGFVTDFFDTLGIGSFATTTTLFRLRRTIPDEQIPGTLNVGHTLPTITQAFIYITIVQVEMQTLALLIAASIVGAVLGASVVTRLPRAQIQLGMGIALLAAAGFMLGKALDHLPDGGKALGLTGSTLAVAILGNFLFGALMTIGIGAYAPIMIMVTLLGMSPVTAFPIMMGSCAFLMPIAGMRFVRSGLYSQPAALGLTLAGIPAVLLAAFLVKELPLDAVRWLVVLVVLYTAVSLLRAAWTEKQRKAVPALDEPG